jgi:hypothetical protein
MQNSTAMPELPHGHFQKTLLTNYDPDGKYGLSSKFQEKKMSDWMQNEHSRLSEYRFEVKLWNKKPEAEEFKIVHIARYKAATTRREEWQRMKVLLAIFDRSGKIREGDGSIMQQISNFVIR